MSTEPEVKEDVFARLLDVNIINKKYFYGDCKNLLLYLDYINKNYLNNDIESSCKYFNYMLKYTLNINNISKKSTKDAYNNMITQLDGNHTFSVPNICKSYAKDISDDTFQKFDNLNKLYTTIERESGTCKKNSACFNIYTSNLLYCKNMNNISYCQELDLLKHQYIENSVHEPVNKEASEIRTSSFPTYIRTVFLTLTITTFAISTIIFILYKIIFRTIVSENKKTFLIKKMKNILHFWIHSRAHTKIIIIRIIE
ncbi:variable surface protein [Plasmodium gonderi]|uniref:Variable surface protein n=1 Tax=Plasmodium gonderi TaxID=77519 RepID=A0A1Y1JWX9_PLAGO|nr:variable surface protein [Plasmodium gonderi]GAW84324.1 variable surface protein [Plasmodium gonderi]